MGYFVLILLCLAWGTLCGLVIKNNTLSLVLGGVGGYAIGTLFQTYHVLGI